MKHRKREYARKFFCRIARKDFEKVVLEWMRSLSLRIGKKND